MGLTSILTSILTSTRPHPPHPQTIPHHIQNHHNPLRHNLPNADSNAHANNNNGQNLSNVPAVVSDPAASTPQTTPPSTPRRKRNTPTSPATPPAPPPPPSPLHRPLHPFHNATHHTPTTPHTPHHPHHHPHHHHHDTTIKQQQPPPETPAEPPAPTTRRRHIRHSRHHHHQNNNNNNSNQRLRTGVPASGVGHMSAAAASTAGVAATGSAHGGGRRVRSAAHYVAGYDPTRPAHYPNSHVADYSTADGAPTIRRLYNAHNNQRPQQNQQQQQQQQQQQLHSRLYAEGGVVPSVAHQYAPNNQPSASLHRRHNPRPFRPHSPVQTGQKGTLNGNGNLQEVPSPSKPSRRRGAQRIVSSLDSMFKRDPLGKKDKKVALTQGETPDANGRRLLHTPRRLRGGSNLHQKLPQKEQVVQQQAVNFANVNDAHSVEPCSLRQLPKLSAMARVSVEQHHRSGRHSYQYHRPVRADVDAAVPVRQAHALSRHPSVSNDELSSAAMRATAAVTATSGGGGGGVGGGNRHVAPPHRISIPQRADPLPTTSSRDSPPPPQAPIRVSADACLPPSHATDRHSADIIRTRSNPSVSRAAAKNIALRRPPPLPLNGLDKTGFSRGAGGDGQPDNDLTQRGEVLPVVRQLKVEKTSFVTDESDGNDGSAGGDEVAGNEVWDDVTTRGTQLGQERQAREDALGSALGVEKEKEKYMFEEASTSSLGDSDTISRQQARNGIVPMDRHQGEVTEDDFRFGCDGTTMDGGFIWFSNGRIQTPEKVMRKISEGLAVEGVPTSSSNLIIVRSLNEFKKCHAFKNGSSTLGRGAAGRVYLAIHEPSKRKIAVKEINFFHPKKRDQLRKELVTLISHQSRFLVRTYGAFYDQNGRVHVTLEYMDRGSLADVIEKQGAIPEPVLCKIAEHCLRGLCFLHNNHILHRDVKSANILLSRKLCRAKLSDFGLARDLKEEGESDVNNEERRMDSVTKTFVGTLQYMSPERLKGWEYSYASDVWALGMTMLECALGRFLFTNPGAGFVEVWNASEESRAELVRGKVSDSFYDFIKQMTDTEAGNRPKAGELLQHEWIVSGSGDVNVLRDWLDTIPKLDMDDDDSTLRKSAAVGGNGGKTAVQSKKSLIKPAKIKSKMKSPPSR